MPHFLSSSPRIFCRPKFSFGHHSFIPRTSVIDGQGTFVLRKSFFFSLFSLRPKGVSRYRVSAIEESFRTRADCFDPSADGSADGSADVISIRTELAFTEASMVSLLLFPSAVTVACHGSMIPFFTLDVLRRARARGFVAFVSGSFLSTFYIVVLEIADVCYDKSYRLKSPNYKQGATSQYVLSRSPVSEVKKKILILIFQESSTN